VRVIGEFHEGADARGAVVTVGVFDGVHRGHQAVVSRAIERARASDLAATVVTFYPHPVAVVEPAKAPLMIEGIERRLERLGELGVDQVRVVRFDHATALEPAGEFVDRLLIGELGARLVVVGEDFRFGHGREGDVGLLSAHGLNVEALDAVGEGGRYSSTGVRHAVSRGDLAEAERVLGHRVCVRGEVVHGDGRGGSELGYPTLNLELGEGMLAPGDGVYAGAARLGDGRWFAAATSMGTRPQFYEGASRSLEVHLVGFDGDLYGQFVDLVLIERLRDEARFDSVGDLVAQIALDTSRCAAIFEGYAPEAQSLLGFTTGQRR